MAHEVAKQMLERAGTFPERQEAVRTALSQGMALDEIERYLDWLDNLPSPKSDRPAPPGASGEADK
jgi:hypothetical protein